MADNWTKKPSTEKVKKYPNIVGEKSTIKAKLRLNSVYEFDGVLYRVVAVYADGYVDLKRVQKGK